MDDKNNQVFKFNLHKIALYATFAVCIINLYLFVVLVQANKETKYNLNNQINNMCVIQDKQA